MRERGDWTMNPSYRIRELGEKERPLSKSGITILNDLSKRVLMIGNKML